MDLRRIVDEVAARKQYELSLQGPSDRASRPAASAGAAGSLLHAVRTRMLTENPDADVTHINAVIEPHKASAPPAAPTVAERPRPNAHVKPHAAPHESDDFLERYLEMSAEFERRLGVKGWADFVAKKTRAHAKPTVPARAAADSARRAKPRSK